jgi:hypothetical protein
MPGIAQFAGGKQINLDSSHAEMQSLSIKGPSLDIGLVLESNLQAPRTPPIMPLLQTPKVIRLHLVEILLRCVVLNQRETFSQRK